LPVELKTYATFIMKKEKIRIVIADDHQMIRETWRLLLEQDKRFHIIAECSNGTEAIEYAVNHAPDIILIDINMNPVNGFEATRKIIRQAPSVKIIGMSINNQPAYARNILKLGAKGYITKNSSKEEMIKAILEVNKGSQYICEEIKKQMQKSG
jgi:DNA-binding NarL/FixJ family response regulator